jgi:DNA repair exonuclease SbcCD nuclease subunit
MSLTVVNDWHLGCIRSSGTTPATAHQLRQDLLSKAEEILYGVTGDLLVNGDLFDGPDIPRADLLQAVRIFGDWLTRCPGHLYLANGNHDLDKNSTRLSSFQFFAALLQEMYGPARVTHITEGTAIPEHNAYVIPHMANQDLFDLELAKVPRGDGVADQPYRFLFVHANYDNQFAVESDHSLNLSKEQAEQLPVEYIVFGHEHQARNELGGKVVIVGNQFPSSISDCLGHQDKQALVVRDGRYEMHTTWQPEGDYSEQDWRDPVDVGRFIRITGTATAAEADKVVTKLSRFRRESSALVITNAVKIEGADGGAELALSHEDVTSFNVMNALLDYLGPDDAAEVTKIMGEENAG